MRRLRFERRPEYEQAVRDEYIRMAGPVDQAPKVFYGYDLTGREVLHVLLSRETWAPGDDRWHISISGPGRVPTWEEISQACHEVRPGVPFAMGVPPKSWWMNVHPDVLHAWELKDEGMLAQWRANAKGHDPS